MDLLAYINIENLEPIAKKNNIEVPRLRGYEWMGEAKPAFLDKEDYNNIAIHCVKDLCESEPFWNPHSDCFLLCSWTNYLKDYFLVTTEDESGYKDYTNIRWDRIHGWKRKVLKTCIHNEVKRYQKAFDAGNKYVGRKDVLRIHSRIGGGNWPYYHKEVDNQHWFLEKVDDPFDSTYCDIYAKINLED